MESSATYCCLGLLFIVLVGLFAVSVRTNQKSRKFCQMVEPLSYMFGGNPQYMSGEYNPCAQVCSIESEKNCNDCRRQRGLLL
jgi:hypothetical protein